MAEIEKGEMAEGILTDEMIEGMRKKIGLKMRIEGHIFNEEATRGAIRRFAYGVGDSNPLWCDENYAQKTRYGRIVASPSFVWSVCAGVQFGWRGLSGFHAGSDMEFYRPVLVNDKITPEVTFIGFDGPISSEFGGLMIKDYYENNYWNQDGKLVAKIKWWVMRVERGKTKEKGKYRTIQLPHPWTEEELKKIEEEVLAEEIRGANPRYWEDVEVGEELKPVVKGPLGVGDMIVWFMGGAHTVALVAHGAALREYRKHPAWAFRDPETHALEPILAVHYSKAAANAQGLPFPYDVGIQRHCWLVHFLTNWMGDDGWLQRCYAEYRKFVYLSDVVWFRGKVTKKYIDEDGEYCVDVETHAINQREEEVAPGHSVVVLPSKEKGTWPPDRRLG